MSERGFLPGQRVMVVDWGVDPVIGKLEGYYGHVTDERTSLPGDHLLHWVRIEGRAGGPPHPAIMRNPLWPFKAHELKHAD